jgi:hypothetical protein
MLKFALAAVAAVSLVTAAHAEMLSDGASSKTVVTRAAPDGTGVKRTIIRKHVDRYGNLVTHRRTITEGMSGSTVRHSRTVTDPMTGRTVTRTTIENQ